MATTNVTEYKCDICGKVHRVEDNPNKFSESPLKEVPMPSRNFDCEGRSHSKGMAKVDMCKDCFENFWNYVQERYGVDNFHGISVKMKGV